MSILDNIPLEVGATYYDNEIIGWNPETQKYLVTSPYRGEPRWLSSERVESAHADSLMNGVEFREANPGNGYNTRFFRSRY